MSINRNPGARNGEPAINVSISGNAQITWSYSGEGPRCQPGPTARDAGADGTADQSFWKSAIFWEAVSAMATVTSAVATFL
ncbi:hypothetical protein [Streptomyces sp. 1114.5]|uniref:hypothetical protein n=1 Tax=Streptomyces sp. 1114.5 TaxID=1938830 RepID=UPI0011C36794|nr:hypothetical protein [Streptomyces sp. 1114.5]